MLFGKMSLLLFNHYITIYGLLKNAIHNTMPIWHNTRICAYFNKEWFNKGIKFVNDLFTDGSFVTIAYLQNTIGVKCNFLEYANIKSRIIKHNINNVQPI